MENHARNYAKILREICAELDIKLTSFCHNWVFVTEKNGKRAHIVGYTFGLDNGAVQEICADKCAASDMMKAFGVPCVEHYFFLTPREHEYFPNMDNWAGLSALLKKHGSLVCKPNHGSGGENIFFVRTAAELENAAFEIFGKNRAMAASPYVEIEQEYRVIMLDGVNELTYSKQRRFIVGDGVSTAAQLAREASERHGLRESAIRLDGQCGWDDILPAGQKVYLNKRHNLGLGAEAHTIEARDVPIEITELAQKTVEAFGLRFASVDIVKEADSGRYSVLEINSGVMMEHFSTQSERNYMTAKRIYKQAILKML